MGEIKVKLEHSATNLERISKANRNVPQSLVDHNLEQSLDTHLNVLSSIVQTFIDIYYHVWYKVLLAVRL